MPKKRFAAANLRDIKNRMSAPASGGTGIPSLRSGQALPMRTAKMAVPQCAAGWRRPPHFGVCDVPKGHVLAQACFGLRRLAASFSHTPSRKVQLPLARSCLQRTLQGTFTPNRSSMFNAHAPPCGLRRASLQPRPTPKIKVHRRKQKMKRGHFYRVKHGDISIRA